jgi:hypothetical protein
MTQKVADVNRAGINSDGAVPERVFYTWDIHYACNYRCSYCFFEKRWDDVAKENRYPGLKTWAAIWEDIFYKYGSGHIHISGGEPSTYPSFIDLTICLTKWHTVEFDTNLSFDVHGFISRVRPGRVKFAAAFHPEFVKLDVFIAKAVCLKQNGYDIGVNFVAFPPHLKEMKVYKEAFNDRHISFDIMPFRGEYQGRAYPEGYTEQERKLIRSCDPATATRMLDAFGTGEKESSGHKGQICRMGQRYTKIHPDGRAYRCCLIKENGCLGNLLDGTFELYPEPRPCEYDHCSCWVAMIVGKERDWAFHWVGPKDVRGEYLK